MQAAKNLTYIVALVFLRGHGFAAAGPVAPQPGGRPGPRPPGGPAPNPFVSDKCAMAIEKWVQNIPNPDGSSKPLEDPKEFVKLCGSVPAILPQECQDADNVELFECGCAFLQDKEFTSTWLEDPSNIDRVAERQIEELGLNQSVDCFLKRDSPRCAVSQANGMSELRRCKASGDYFQVSRNLMSQYPMVWSVAATAEVCLPKQCQALIPKLMKFVEKSTRGPGGGPPGRRPTGPETWVARRLSEIPSAEIAMPSAPLQPLALIAGPIRRAASSTDGPPPGMPFSDPKCPPPNMTDLQKTCSRSLSDCSDLEKSMVKCACGFVMDQDFMKSIGNMSMVGQDVAKQLECLSKNFPLKSDDAQCKDLTAPAMAELKTCKTGGKKDWGYCVTGNGIVADLPGKWLTTRLSMMMGVCLPNACHSLLTSKELVMLMEKSMEMEKADMMKRRDRAKALDRQEKEAATKALQEKKATCAATTSCQVGYLPTGEMVICERSSTTGKCDVDKYEVEYYNNRYGDCSSFDKAWTCQAVNRPAYRCSWHEGNVGNGTCMDRPDDAMKENEAAEKFLSKCKGGKCTLPFKCGADADQKFLDDVGKKTQRRIRTFLKIRNMDFDKLVSNKALRMKFEKATKKAIARKIGNGVTEDHVVLTLSKGSVNVDVTIIPESESAADNIVAKVNSARNELSDAVINDVKAVEGIKEVEEGEISATEASTAESDKSTAIEPVSPTGEKLVDPGTSPTPSPGPGPTPSPGPGPAAPSPGTGPSSGNNKSGWVMPLVIVLALVGAAGVGVFFFQQSKAKRLPARGYTGNAMEMQRV